MIIANEVPLWKKYALTLSEAAQYFGIGERKLQQIADENRDTGIVIYNGVKQASIGFYADLKDKYDNDPHLLEKVTVDDLRNFGMIPEFLGRLPVIFTLNGLNEDMLVKILSEPRNAILKQYQKLLALDEVKLEFDEGALHAIAAKAMEKNTGARALRAILEEYMLDIMYEIPKDDSIGQVIITKEYIEGNGGPQILLRGQEVPLLPHND